MKTKNNNKNLILYIINKTYLFLILSFIPLTNSLIEIPIKTIKVKGIPKYRNISIQDSLDYSKIENLNRPIILNEEGGMKYNGNRLFLATIKIGSNNQEFNLVLDTGSYILWVPKEKSIDSGNIENHYNPTSSKTSKFLDEQFEQKYGTGSCSGYYYSDNFKYINNKVFNIIFGVADYTDFDVSGGDGIIGLAHYYSKKEESFSFIHMLKKYKITDTLSFSLKFEKKEIYEGMTGKLIIGNHKDFSSNYSVTCPLKHVSTGDIFWICEVNSLGLQNSIYKAESNLGNYAIFDTGTNVIMVPLEYYISLKSEISNFGCQSIKAEDQTSIQLVCEEENRIDFRFEINGNVLIVPKDIGFYRAFRNLYYSRVLFAQGNFIIGSPFFTTFHTLFDKENEKLHFYPENPKYIEIYDTDVFSIVGIALVIILLLVIFGFIIYKCIQWKRAKRELEDLPSSNYYGYNANFL